MGAVQFGSSFRAERYGSLDDPLISLLVLGSPKHATKTECVLRNEFGLSYTQALVIACLAGSRIARQVDLARYLSLDDATVSRLVSRLVAKGMAVRRKTDNKRHGAHIFLTDDGKALAPCVIETMSLIDDTLKTILNIDNHGQSFFGLMRRKVSS